MLLIMMKDQKYESILNKWYDGEFESVVKDFEEIHYLSSGKKSKVWRDLN